ncbi:hypothetical protein [Erythrobacter sp. EC-HK427]|uniref:hypothetical protein n=1 Tax=Erythrobacter sp. EC-HK427 TaxID=2038396 RepID=UPI00125A31C7|nr:hypothetical protein [Erythrobacter sp. EC-HK427]VVT14395.1 conserved hypothetical protein [Erythrobacter sp. EC-HK427]
MSKRSMIVISGLRRSGTTALWECFRHSAAIAAFDEPFHPRLAAGDRSNPKGTWRELAAFFEEHPDIAPPPIDPLAELSSVSDDAQRDYLEQLGRANSHVAIDVVRCWNRLPALYSKQEDVLTVQLVRDPQSWITGHLLPSGKGTWKKALADRYRRASFFTRKGYFDNYHYETIIAEALRQDHRLWRAVTPSAAELAKAPAFIKLLAFWWGTNAVLRRALLAAGQPSVLTTLHDLSHDPGAVLQAIASAAGWDVEELRHDHITGTRPSVGAENPQWREAARFLGIPEAIVRPGGAGAAALEAAFDAAATRLGEAA